MQKRAASGVTASEGPIGVAERAALRPELAAVAWGGER
eukprot:ctg_4848.g623